MMMASMKAKRGKADMIDTMVKERGEVSTKELVNEGAELGASLPVDFGCALLNSGRVQFPDGVGFPGGAECDEGLEFGVSVPEGEMDKFLGEVDEVGSSCSAGWQPFNFTWFCISMLLN